MPDVELVIKIPEKTYKDIQSLDWKNGEKWYSEEWKAIHNGTPLPKGHGRLIDADEIQFENNEFDTYNDYSKAFDAIDYAPTIIEADKAESENK